MQHEIQPNVPVIPGFTMLAKIGEGGMGSVYLARATDTHHQVAIKLLHDPTLTSKAERHARFEREARVMALAKHPNIVAVLDHGSVGGLDYLIMEHVPGQTLKEEIAESAPLTPIRTSEILGGIVAALACLHDQRIVHRDLKPGNILFDSDGQVKLTDFGISGSVDELGQITVTGQFVGSLDYIAPEQRSRLRVDERADQFALAVITYEMLTGKRPVGTYKAPSKINLQLNRAVDPIVARALEEDPDDRYPNVTDFEDALRGALTRSSSRRRVGTLIALYAGVLVALVWGWGSFFGTSSDVPGGNADGTGSMATSKAPQGKQAASTDPVVDDKALAAKARADKKTQAKQIAEWVRIADEHLASGDPSKLEAATKALDTAISMDDSDPNLFLRRAMAHKFNRMFQLALNDLATVRKLAPKDPDGWLGAGSIYLHLKDYDKAIELLTNALDLEEEFPEIHAWRGWAYHGQKKDTLALDDLRRAIELDGNCDLAYRWLGLICVGREEFEEALENFNQCLRINPNSRYNHYSVALILAESPHKKLRDGKAAVRHAKRANELTNYRVWRYLRVLAAAHAEAGDLDAAITHCARALRLAPENQVEQVERRLNRYKKKRADQRVPPR